MLASDLQDISAYVQMAFNWSETLVQEGVTLFSQWAGQRYQRRGLSEGM